jgi:diadenylate cyclase
MAMAMTDLSALPEQIIEVAVFATLLYLVLRFLRETRGSGVVRGLAFLLIAGVITFVVLIQTLELRRLELLFQTIANAVVIGLIIVFHPEIRRAIVHLGDSPIFGRFFQKESKIVQRALRAVARMSKERIGALIAVEREASLQTLAESGITIDAELNSFLIESVFYPKSPLHDGAIVVRDDRIVAASCLLPLSQNPEVDKRLGTRHRAALGLTEETDALAIVVSEETGRISTALGGKLSYDLTLEQLERQLDEALGLRQRSNRRKDRGGLLRTGWSKLLHDPVRKLAAIVLGVGLWFYLDSRTFELPLAVIDVERPIRSAQLSGLFVQVPTEAVEVQQFIDQSSGRRIDRVQLTISGPNYSVDALTDALAIDVTLPKVDWGSVPSAEFTVSDLLRPRSLSSTDFKLTMSPPRVRLQVVKVARSSVTLNPATIDIDAEASVRARIRLESIEFNRRSATVVGPAAALKEFDKAPEPRLVARVQPLQGASSITTSVDLAQEFVDAGLKLLEKCSVVLSLKPQLTPFTLKLPVVVIDRALPENLRGQFVAEVPERGIDVVVNAGGSLRTKLSSMSPAERQQWAQHNLHLLAVIPERPAGTIEDEFPVQAELHVLGIIRATVQSADYELSDPVSVTLRRTGP